jgi:hypothetical protein
MKCSAWNIAAILLCLAAVAGAASAGVIALPPPGPARVANSNMVLVGKVESLEPQDVKVGTINYRIAVVKITDGIKGVKEGTKTVRIGFEPIEKPDGKGPIVIRTGARPVQLEAGQGGLFLLRKHDKQDFYVIGGVVGYYVNSDKNKDFDAEVKAAKAATKVVDNPLAALKSKDAEERLLAAAILVDKHRTYRGPKSREEPIAADESKLILKAMADGEWKDQPNYMSLRANPMQLFQRLGVGKNDGFVIEAGNNYQQAARAWLTRNADTYRIQRFVAEEKK